MRTSGKKNRVVGVMMAQLKSLEQAKEYAEKIKNCPYRLFSVVGANILCSVFIVSKEHEWWLKYPAKNPERVGFQKVKVYIKQIPAFPFHIPLRRLRGRATLAPCGADCRDCDLRVEYNCRGCPAISFYHE